jgi:hypothetical protein
MSIRSDGEFFGYPKCCIDFYIKESTVPYWFRKYERKYPLAWTKLQCGFIPCEKHLKQLEIGEKIESLIKNRKCPTDYPIGPDEIATEVVSTFFNKYKLENFMKVMIWLKNNPPKVEDLK